MTGAPFELSICADTFLTELPFAERISRIADAGFAVEFWSWMGRDTAAIAHMPGVRVAGFNGYIGGSMVHPDWAEAFLDGVRKSIPIALDSGVRELFLTTGEIGRNGEVVHAIAEDPSTRAITAWKVLSTIADLAERYNLVYNLENLNTKVDHAGYSLPRVADVLALIDGLGSALVRVLLDLYHAQVQEGNLIDLIRTTGRRLGHIQVADVPGRHEPGTGEVNYPAVATALRSSGYAGVIGLEAFPLAAPDVAMRRFREAFDVPG